MHYHSYCLLSRYFNHDDDDDYFFFRGAKKNDYSNNSNGRSKDPFNSLFKFAGFENDDFFSNPFGNIRGMGMDFDRDGAGFSGSSKSVSTSTIIK